MHGTSINPYAREPSRNIPRGWTFIRLVSPSSRSRLDLPLSLDFQELTTSSILELHQAPNKKTLGYLETQHQHATSKPTMEDLNERSCTLPRLFSLRTVFSFCLS